MMNNLLNWLMLSCKRATELMEKKSFVGLSTKEKISIRLHTSICDGCAIYQKQSLLIDKLLQQRTNRLYSVDAPDIRNDELESRIISKLNEK
ncbi:hypothetical protein ACVWYG_001216 [Pedobacter sp. UYEF25]